MLKGKLRVIDGKNYSEDEKFAMLKAQWVKLEWDAIDDYREQDWNMYEPVKKFSLEKYAPPMDVFDVTADKSTGQWVVSQGGIEIGVAATMRGVYHRLNQISKHYKIRIKQ